MLSYFQSSVVRLCHTFPQGFTGALRMALSACGVALWLLTIPAQAAQVTLAWDDPQNLPSAVGGYNLYYWQGSATTPVRVNAGKQLTYTLTNLTGGQTYSFAVTAYDVNGGRESALSNTKGQVSTTLPVGPVGNVAPVATNSTLSTAEDTPRSGTLRATDANGNALTYSVVTQGSKGTAVLTNASTGAYTYTPQPNANGTDPFTFRASDGLAQSNLATVTVTITPVNDAPVASNGTLTTTANMAVNGTLRASDVDGDTLIYRIVTNGSKGTVTLTDTTTGAYIYTPYPNATGTDTFTFQAQDSTTSSNIATVTVTSSAAAMDEVVFAVNAGGPAYTGKDGTVYQADTRFSGGSTYTRSVAIAGTEDDALYQSERYGNFAYTIPVPNGDYLVTLKFAEIYWTAAGQRRFDVLIEGREALSDLDLVAKVGPVTAYDVAMPVRVTDGVLNIQFVSNLDSAKVSAIVVETSGQIP